MGDDVLVTQVFANLIDNAQKYLEPSRPGEITISGKIVDGWSVYAITDNGIGISPEHHARIFQVFNRKRRRIGISHCKEDYRSPSGQDRG
jgi:signal transduction histidine kinase